MKQQKRVLLLIIGIVLTLFLCGNKSEAADTSRVVRVGYPIQEGMTEKDSDGNYSGYTYEYLMTLAQYTGYRYEFVEMEGDAKTQHDTCIKMLENGEIDLMGSMPYNEELASQCSYVMNNYGTYGLALYVKAENHVLNTTSVYSVNSIKVAVRDDGHEDETKALEAFVDEHKLTVQIVHVASAEEQLAALDDGRADALLANTMEKPAENLRSIRQFDTNPIYFVTCKDENTLNQELNTAIAENQENDPAYATTLSEKYFSDPAQIIDLTEEEKAYIKTLDTLKVISLGGNAPLNYVGTNGEPQGFISEMLGYITDNSGIKFDLSVNSQMTSFREEVESNEADIIVCRADMKAVLRNSGYYVSRTCLSIPISLVMNAENGVNDSDERRQAIPYLAAGTDATEFVGTPEACLDAINSGEADFGYINSYATDYYTRVKNLNHIYVYLQSEGQQESLVIAINERVSGELLPIINKLLHNMDEQGETEDFLYQSISGGADMSLLYYARHNAREVLLMAAVILCILLSLMIAYRYRVEKKSKQYILEQSRKDSLTGVMERYAFLEETRKVLDGIAPGTSIIYLMIDVDDFKNINDSYGHTTGDKVLREIAMVLMGTFPEENSVGRIGGDEFAVIIRDQGTVAQINRVLDGLFEKLKLVTIGDDKRNIGLSIGGVKTDEKIPVNHAYDKADQIMYQVKKSGGNTWRIEAS